MYNTSIQNRRPIIVFLLITFLLSSCFYFPIIYSGKIGSVFGIYVTGIMWCPGLAALITCRLSHIKIASFAWRWGSNKYQFWSYAIPFFYTATTYLIVWSAGLGAFFNAAFVKEVSASYGWQRLPDGIIILAYIVLMGLYGMAGSASAALGEEIGWRGFLVPAFLTTNSYTTTSLLVGIIWALWHFPLILFADYNNGTPIWYSLTCFTIQIISTSFIITWLRVKSKSLWTSVLFHASHNLFIQAIFNPLTTDTGHTNYFTDEFGIILPVACSLFAFYFWTRRKELPAYEEGS